MALDSPKVLEKIQADLKQRCKRYQHVNVEPGDLLRKGLSNSIMEGMQEAFKQVRNRGKDLAFRVIGVDTSWSNWDIKKGPLKDSLLEEIQPDIDELAKQLANEFREEGLNKLTKTRKRELLKSLRRSYEREVDDQVNKYFAQTIKEQAAKDVEEMWQHMPVLLGKGNTLEDVVAEHFTAMIAQDADLNEETAERNLELVRDELEWMATHYPNGFGVKC